MSTPGRVPVTFLTGLHWRPDGRALAALDARGGITAWRVSSG